MNNRANTLALLVFAAALASAQTKEDMAKMAAYSTPGKQHKLLASLAGSWKSTVKYVIGGKSYTGTAKMKAETILGGRFIRMEYNSSMNGTPLTVLEHLGYDNSTTQFTESMMSTSSTAAYLAFGTMAKDGKTITTVGLSNEPGVNGQVKLRVVTKLVDADHFTIDWFMTLPGKAEDHTVSITSERMTA